VNLRAGLLDGEVHAKPLSHAGDGTTEPMLAVAQCHCRVMLAMLLLGLAGDGAAEVMLAMAWCHY
jgi:hypothetical protein